MFPDDVEVVIRPRSGGAADRTRLRFALAVLPLAAAGVARQFHGAARTDFFAQTSIRVSNSDVRRTGYLGRSASRDQTLLRAYAEYYPASELSRLRETLHVGWDTLPNVRTFAQVRRDIPSSFPWSLAHIWLTLVLITLAALVIGGLIAANV